MRTTQKDFYLVLIYIFLSSLLLLADSWFKIGFLHAAIQFVGQPVRHELLGTRNSLFSPLAAWSEAQENKKKLELLNGANIDIQTILLQTKQLEEENKEMRNLLDADLPTPWELSQGRVVGRMGDTIYLLSDYTPVANEVVLTTIERENATRGGVYVGRINARVGREIEVWLPTHIESKVPVQVRQGKTQEIRASGIVLGRGGNVLLDQVLSSEVIEVGDLIVTSGEGGLPPDLYVGTISHVLETPNSTWKQAGVSLGHTQNNLGYVAIVKKF